MRVDAGKPLLSMQAVRRRWRGLGMLTVAALLAHVLAFSGLDVLWPTQRAGAPAPAAVQLRVIEQQAALPEARLPVPMPVVVPVLVPAPLVKPAVARVRAAPVQRAPVPAAAAPVEAPAAEPPAENAVEPAVAILASGAAPVAAVESVAGVDTIPHYRTQMPPAATLHYVMQRGALSGKGDLSWRPAGDRYELRLEARVAGLSVLTQISSGGFDASGVAPVRFTDQRLRRGTKAANFQRAAGKITFSGPTTEFALRPGTQDRLSWMVQLGAIVAAEPKLRGVGAKVVMVVVGANGEMSVWAFDCTAIESVPAGAGSVSAMKFVREPREQYDTQVQVWLDPAQHYLPVRAVQKSGAGDDAFDLRLQSIDNNP